MEPPFVIDQVSWHTATPGNSETREQITHRFYIVSRFLQENGLTCRSMKYSKDDIDEYFSITSGDLNTDGLEVMKMAYDNWLRRIDSGMSPEDTTLLMRALYKVRSR